MVVRERLVLRSVVLMVVAIFLVASVAVFAAKTSGGCGGGGGGCGGGGGDSSSVIDPPVGPLFRDPVEAVNVSNEEGIVEVNLVAKVAPVYVNGIRANLMTYNGYFPGPTIRVNKGDILKVNIKNSLPNTTAKNILGYQKNLTNLHTHGFHVSPEPPGDYVMYALKSGETYNHEYDTCYQEAGVLNFYHGHKHGVSAEQYWAGMVGALITRDENQVLAGYETHTLILKDISLSGSSPTPHSTMMDFMHGKEGNIMMVNGQVNPRLNIKAGQVQRWQILNASNARFYKLALDGHAMHLIGTDGGLLDRPYQISEILLSPGERVDVLVKGVQASGNYKFKALPYSRMGMNTSPTITLMTVSYNGSVPSQSLPVSINQNAERIEMDTSMLPHRTLTLSMGQGNAYINGKDFDAYPDYMMIMSHLGTYEVWTIVNQSGMDHPFHQHVNAAQVLAINGGDPGYASLYTSIPAMKDTVLVPKFGSVDILVPVMHYAGMTMFHCHILEHEDIGMMGNWHIMGMEMPM